MLQKESILKISDTCKVLTIKIFHIYGGFNTKIANCGFFVKGSVKTHHISSTTKIKKKVVGIIIRLKAKVPSLDGTILITKENNCVLLKKRTTPIGNEIIGPVYKKIKRKKLLAAAIGIIN